MIGFWCVPLPETPCILHFVLCSVQLVTVGRYCAECRYLILYHSLIADVIIALDHQLDTQWREFGTFLHVTPAFMDRISNDKSNVTPCMLQLVEKWFVHEDGTGDLPRTWQTVVQVVKHTGKGRLAEQLAEQYRVQLPVQ